MAPTGFTLTVGANCRNDLEVGGSVVILKKYRLQPFLMVQTRRPIDKER